MLLQRHVLVDDSEGLLVAPVYLLAKHAHPGSIVNALGSLPPLGLVLLGTFVWNLRPLRDPVTLPQGMFAQSEITVLLDPAPLSSALLAPLPTKLDWRAALPVLRVIFAQQEPAISKNSLALRATFVAQGSLSAPPILALREHSTHTRSFD